MFTSPLAGPCSPGATPFVAAMHPVAGLLSLDYTNLWLGQRLGTRIVAYSPAEDPTRTRLERLHASLA